MFETRRNQENKAGDVKEVIRDLYLLKKRGKLNEKEYSRLITLAWSVFVENELERKIDRVLLDKTNRIFERFNYG